VFKCMKIIKRASLDGVEFRTAQSQEKFKMNNACVMMNYLSAETGQEVIGYGVIQKMFTHQFWPDDPEAPEKVIVQADWYELVGANPINGLPQIRRNNNFNACSVAFLDMCVAANCIFMPSDPITHPANGLFDVILHPTQL
jgi:hypothetical protein